TNGPSTPDHPGGGAWAPSETFGGPRPTERVMAHDSAGRRNVVGVVRSIQTRQEGRSAVWNFRVERFDGQGNRLPPMPVELRAKEVVGALSEGDWVRVPAKWVKGRTTQVKRVRDLTTDTDVGAPRHTTRYVVLFIVLLAIIIAGLIVGS